MAVSGGPTVRRVRLGKQLAEARRALNMTRTDVATAMEVSESTVTRWETGRGRIQVPFLRGLLTHLNVTDDARVQELLSLAREGRQRDWMAELGGELGQLYRTLLGLEEDALAVMDYEAIVIPGLLQTNDYAKAVHLAELPAIDDAVIDGRLKVRAERQDRFFHRDPPPVFHAILDEGCLLRRVGGDEVWRAQLRHLVEMSEHRNVTLQVLRFDVGAHASTLGAFLLMEFTDMNPVAYIEVPAGDILLEAGKASVYVQRFRSLATVALPPPQSVAWIHQVATES